MLCSFRIIFSLFSSCPYLSMVLFVKTTCQKTMQKNDLQYVIVIPTVERNIKCEKQSNKNVTKQITEKQTINTSNMNNRKVVKSAQPPISTRGPRFPLAHSAESKWNTRTRAKVNRPRNATDANGRLKTKNNPFDQASATVTGKSVIQDTSELPFNTPYKVCKRDTSRFERRCEMLCTHFCSNVLEHLSASCLLTVPNS